MYMTLMDLTKDYDTYIPKQLLHKKWTLKENNYKLVGSE